MISDFETSALWLIVDPWIDVYNQGSLKCPDIDDINKPVIKNIAKYISRCKHVLVSCPVYEDGQKIKIADELRHLPNINNNFDLLKSYIDRNKISDLVYTGFHHGSCILTRPIGAINVSLRLPHLSLYLKKDLVGKLPYLDETMSDTESQKYMKFI
jgi:hypothetical protein